MEQTYVITYYKSDESFTVGKKKHREREPDQTTIVNYVDLIYDGRTQKHKDRIANYRKTARIRIPSPPTADFEFTLSDDDVEGIEDDVDAVRSLVYFIFEEPENFKF